VTDLISYTDNLLGIHHLSEMVRLVTFIFVIMTIGIVAFFFFTFFTLVVHQLSKSFNSYHHKRYTNWIINYLLDPEMPEPDAGLVTRKAFRNAILDLLLVTKGFEKNLLLKLYVKRGLWDHDLSMLKNGFWFRRLAGLVRLDQWQFCLGLERLSHLLNDEHFQIRQIAIKNLSRTKELEEAEYLLDQLTKVETFYSVKYEAVFRMIRIHREMIISSLDDEKFSAIHNCVLKVAGDSRILEAVPALLKVARGSPVPEYRETAIISLGKIGDPRGVDIFKSAMSSEDPKERLAALKSLFEIDNSELTAFEGQLKNDPDPDVRSWINHYMKGGV
jgi:HEAT repeats